ncbi:MAG: hypothetical protein WAK26_01050 [Terracidiphilus sp.]
MVGLIWPSAAMAQKAAQKATTPVKQKTAGAVAQTPNGLAGELAQRLSNELHAKTVVGEPIKAGSVTLIPILMVDVNFAGGTVPMPGVDGFLMSGESRPLGFVAITKKGTRFISVGNTPAR